jgi:phosphatidylserine decarboxylase
MTDMNKMPVTTLGVKWEWPSIHPEGRKFAVIAGVISILLFAIGWKFLAWPMVGVTVWVCAFFRDPVRSVPLGKDFVIAPADGMVCLIQNVPPPVELLGEDGMANEVLTRVSIFMSVFDVHINRSPIEGTVRKMVYIPGDFLDASLDKASEANERHHFLVERSDGLKVGFTQIAGLVARRIVPFGKEGDIVTAGQRVGLIRFGSRVDVYLPKGAASRVTLGQRCVAGETIIGCIGDGEAAMATRL